MSLFDEDALALFAEQSHALLTGVDEQRVPSGGVASVVSRIVHSWKDRGIVIDGGRDGPPVIAKADDLPHGTVVVLSRDGDKVSRTDLADEKLSDYSSVVKAVAAGSSASAKADTANAALPL